MTVFRSFVWLVCAWSAGASAATSATSAQKPVAATADALLTRVQGIQATASKREHFSVNFAQSFFSALSKKNRQSSGALEFSAPRAFRWEVRKPSLEVYVTDGKDFWKYTEATRHAQRLPPAGLELDFVDLVLKLSSLTERYDVAAWTPSPEVKTDGAAATKNDAVRSDEPPATESGTLLLALTPKKEGGQKRIYLGVDEAKASVKELRIVYANGNRTRIVFEPLKLAKVDVKRFTFTPPAGTAVDRM